MVSYIIFSENDWITKENIDEGTMLLIWKLFLTLRYFLYCVPRRLLVGTGPSSLRWWPFHSIFWHLQLDLDFAYWMVGRPAPISGPPSPYFRRPRLRWFFGGDRVSRT